MNCQLFRFIWTIENLPFVHINNIVPRFNVFDSDLGDGSVLNIKKCSSKCQLNPFFIPRDRVHSSSTNRLYDCIVPPGKKKQLGPTTTNVIYCLTCDNCALQYVGQTVQTLTERFYLHIGGINGTKKQVSCRILTEHFTSGPCNGATWKVQIIEKLEGEGRTKANVPDKSITRQRVARELQWMLKLRTVYPYGLNDRMGDEWKTESNQKLIGRQFPKLVRNFSRNTKGNNKNQNDLDPVTFLNIVEHLLQFDLVQCMNYIRIKVASLSKSVLKQVREIISDTILVQEELEFSQWYLAIIDAIESKLYVETPEVPKKKPPSCSIKLNFVNKAMEVINVGKILHSPSLYTCFPKTCKKQYEAPTVIYKLEDTIHSKIFNQNKFIRSLNLEAFLKDESILPCECTGSHFIDSHHKHIVTGDLSIITNNKLRKLFSKGPNYREPITPNFENAREEIVKMMNDLINTWSNKFKLDKRVFLDWKSEFEKLLSERISSVSKNFNIRKVVPTLEQISPKKALNYLQKKYVITSIDKATGNVAFICKRFYAKILIDELGYNVPDMPTEDKTYIQITDTSTEEIIDKHKREMKNQFGLGIDEDNMSLPGMYWSPKMHKTPSKARFIVAASSCTLKPLARKLTSIFKVFQRQVQNFHLKGRFFSGVKHFWVIQDKQPVIKSIKNINKRRCAKSISTYDFSTLYTKIPHDKLKDVLHKITDFCWEGCKNVKIRVNDQGAFWSKGIGRNKDKELEFSHNQVKNAITYLLDNCYFQVGNSVFKQNIGIPMGSDPAPFMANLFLYFYENQFITELKKSDLQRARRFGNVFRFIDDLNAINDGGEFDRCYKDIYPLELELKKENNGNSHASFLDLEITITDNRTFSLKLYDKRDAFPFTIVRLPYLSSNMPSRIFYSAVSGELLRIARCTSESNDFSRSCKTLLQRVKNQGAKPRRLNSTLKKAFNSHLNEFTVFFKSDSEFRQNVLHN